MIRLENITLSYEGRVLINALNEQIEKGEKVVIAGPSGSGKSSLLSLVTGFLQADSGKIWINGEQITVENREGARNIVAWVPQEFYLPYQSACELMEVLLQFKVNRNIPKPQDNEVYNLLKELALTQDYWTKSFTEMSGGERQRILIIVALLLKKPILLLDEPTSALDVESVWRVISLLKKQDITLVAVSHDTQFINSFDRVINLRSNE